MSKAKTLANLVSTGSVLADGTIDAAEIGNLTLPTGGDIVGTTSTQTLTNKTISYSNNTLTGVLPTTAIGVTVQAYDANTAKYNASIANFTGTLRQNGVNVVTLSGTQSLTNKTLVNPIVTLGSTQGTAGQIPVSQGAGLPPVWTTPESGFSYATLLKFQ